MINSGAILLTGATGYLGSHLLRLLVNRGEKVVIVKRSTSDTGRIHDILDACEGVFDLDECSLDHIFTESKINCVVHTAASYGRKGETLRTLFESNLQFPFQLLECSVSYNVESFFNISTTLPRTINPYALSKKQLEEWLSHFSSLGLKVINIAPAYFYGPGDDNSKFVTMLIEKMKLNAAAIELTACTQKRDFIYIDDLVIAFSKLFDSKKSLENFSTFEVGLGKGIELRSLVLELASLLQYDAAKLKFGAIAQRQNEPSQLIADITEITKLGWTPSIGLDEGLRSIIEKYGIKKS